VTRRAKVVCPSCSRHWDWETVYEQLEIFPRPEGKPNNDQVDRVCPVCKAKAKDEAGIGPQFARSLADEREGRTFKAWSPHRRTA
jgi:hypothetical protein